MITTPSCLPRYLLAATLGLFCLTASAVQEGIMEANGSIGLITDFNYERKEIHVDGFRFHVSRATKVTGQNDVPMSLLAVKPGMVMQIFIDSKSVTPAAKAATLSRLVFIRMEMDELESYQLLDLQ